jgi:hypothetical protein|tara:strand:- start:542 stop:712 length:171 start_codon:yes stop_codon:yes gene_type:complete
MEQTIVQGVVMECRVFMIGGQTNFFAPIARKIGKKLTPKIRLRKKQMKEWGQYKWQ